MSDTILCPNNAKKNKEILNFRENIEAIIRKKLTEGTEVSSNSMKQLNVNKENAVVSNDMKEVA